MTDLQVLLILVTLIVASGGYLILCDRVRG